MTKHAFVLAAALALPALTACGRPDDIKTLHHEAITVASYYRPMLDGLDKRVQEIFKRGTTIPANLPGIEEVGKRLTEARDTIVQLRGIIEPGPDGKSAVQKQADLAAKDRRVEDLEKLVDDTEGTLGRGTAVINDDLYAVESWIALYDQGINRSTERTAPPPVQQETQPAPPSPPVPAPGVPAPSRGGAVPPPAGNHAAAVAPAHAGSAAAPAGHAGSAAH